MLSLCIEKVHDKRANKCIIYEKTLLCKGVRKDLGLTFTRRNLLRSQVLRGACVGPRMPTDLTEARLVRDVQLRSNAEITAVSCEAR